MFLQIKVLGVKWKIISYQNYEPPKCTHLLTFSKGTLQNNLLTSLKSKLIFL